MKYENRYFSRVYNISWNKSIQYFQEYTIFSRVYNISWNKQFPLKIDKTKQKNKTKKTTTNKQKQNTYE